MPSIVRVEGFGNTLLRLVRVAELELHPSARVVGIDDWAWRRGQRHGTIVCDLERQRVIDVLPDRSAEAVASWLRQHPGVEVIARDRAGAYAEGARRGAPQAKQVADRWHLLRNLCDALQRAVDRHHLAVRRAARAVSVAGGVREEASPVARDARETRSRADRLARRGTRYEELQRLHACGLPMREIAPALGMSAVAAYRWLRAGGPPTHDKPAQSRALDPYVTHLEAQWREGCRKGWRFWRELRERGFTGAVNAVARWVARQRRNDPPPEAAQVRSAAKWPEPSSRRCAMLLTTPPDKLDGQESEFRSYLAKMAPDLTRAVELAIRCADGFGCGALPMDPPSGSRARAAMEPAP